MSHFAYVLPLGIWPTNTVVLHGYMQQIDQNLFKAINGDDGGTWAPASLITIGGAGLFIAANTTLGASSGNTLTVNATSSFTATAGFATGFTCGGTGAFNGAITVAHNATLGTSSSDTLTVNATSAFASPAAFAAGGSLGTSISDTWTCNAALNVVNGAVFQAGLQNDGVLNSIGDLLFSSSGSTRYRVVSGTASNSTYSVSTADRVKGAALGAGTFTYTIDNTGVAEGKEIQFQVNGGTINFQRADLTSLGSITSSGSIITAVFMYTGGQWIFWGV